LLANLKTIFIFYKSEIFSKIPTPTDGIVPQVTPEPNKIIIFIE